IWAGFVRVIESPYLLGLAGQTICTTVTATFLYFQQATIVQAAAAGSVARTTAFGNIDLWVNVTTVIVQALGTGRLLSRLGLAFGLAVTPVVNALGSLALALEPRLGMLIGIQAARRASHYGIERPAREVLFTVVSAEDKYKAKSLLDTFVYRGGDMAGGWAFRGLSALGLLVRGSALVAIPLSAVWVARGPFLGRGGYV